MRLLQLGVSLLLFVLLSCSSDDTLNTREDKPLVKEITVTGASNFFDFYEQKSVITYTKQALVSTIKSSYSYVDHKQTNPVTNKGKQVNEKEIRTFHYNEDFLIDKVVSDKGAVVETKYFHYNDNNDLISIEESHKETHFYRGEDGLVTRIVITLADYAGAPIIHDIAYDFENNITRLITNMNQEFYFSHSKYNHSFIHTNLNLSLDDQFFYLNDDYVTWYMKDFLDNYQYVYKGKKAIIKIEGYWYNDSYTIIEKNNGLVSSYFRENSLLKRDTFVSYKYY